MVVLNLTATADYLADELRKFGFVTLLEGGFKVPSLVACRFQAEVGKKWRIKALMNLLGPTTCAQRGGLYHGSS